MTGLRAHHGLLPRPGRRRRLYGVGAKPPGDGHDVGLQPERRYGRRQQVRKTPSWPRSWANFSPFIAYSCIPTGMHPGPTCIFWANLTPFSHQPRGGRPGALPRPVQGRLRRRPHVRPARPTPSGAFTREGPRRFLAFRMENRFCVAPLCGGAGRLTAVCGGFRPGAGAAPSTPRATPAPARLARRRCGHSTLPLTVIAAVSSGFTDSSCCHCCHCCHAVKC